jgi:hypothetical protein
MESLMARSNDFRSKRKRNVETYDVTLNVARVFERLFGRIREGFAADNRDIFSQ